MYTYLIQTYINTSIDLLGTFYSVHVMEYAK